MQNTVTVHYIWRQTVNLWTLSDDLFRTLSGWQIFYVTPLNVFKVVSMQIQIFTISFKCFSNYSCYFSNTMLRTCTEIPGYMVLKTCTEIPAYMGLKTCTEIPAYMGLKTYTEIPAYMVLKTCTEIPAYMVLETCTEIPGYMVLKTCTEIPAYMVLKTCTEIPVSIE